MAKLRKTRLKNRARNAAGIKVRDESYDDLVKVHGERCWYCGTPKEVLLKILPDMTGGWSGVKLHVDHIVPKSDGGNDSFPNLALACGPCNRAKTNMPLHNFLLWLEQVRIRSPRIGIVDFK